MGRAGAQRFRRAHGAGALSEARRASNCAAGGSAPAPGQVQPSAAPAAEGGSGQRALYHLSVTVEQAFAEKLEQARAELSHSVPDGDPARILELALDALLLQARRRRRAERIADRRKGAAEEACPATLAAAVETPGGRVKPSAGRPEPPRGGAETPTGCPETLADRVETSGGRAKPRAGQPKTSAGRPEASVDRPEPPARAKTQADRPEAPTGRAKPSARRPQTPTGSNPPPRNRHIPARIRRAVWARDEGCCTFTDAEGNRCRSRWFLQIDHIHPYARGGDHSLDNLRLLCGAHNRGRNHCVDSQLPQAARAAPEDPDPGSAPRTNRGSHGTG